MVTQTGQSDACDPLEAALAEFCAAISEGRTPDPATFCAQHPECGPALAVRIDDLLFAQQGLADLRRGRDPGDADLGAGYGKRTAPPETPSVTSPDDIYAPGTLLLGRYRIVLLVGRGGMGEVYRADDLVIGQPIALKFLPSWLAQDVRGLERFRSEVRLARSVTHPNVTRVYDIGQVGGRHFLTMEFVDGEDLAGLVRRIGRLPRGKAKEIAVQICAGLAAAHAKGVLHGDLKPANVMLDGQGRARLTDFGLAAAVGSREARQLVGTPAYMPPEQIAGEPLQERSEVYSLGLVLYELFTGTCPFANRTVEDVVRLRALSCQRGPRRMFEDSSMAVPVPSAAAADIDPELEQTLLRCLEPEPSQRLPSVRSVALRLPGGDPVAAAFVSGEILSPEVLADAGEQGGLTLRASRALLVALLLGLVSAILLSAPLLTEVTALVHPPAVLVEKAREVLRVVGLDEEPVDFDFGFEHVGVQLEPLPYQTAYGRDRPPTGSSSIVFCYREGTARLVPANGSPFWRPLLHDPAHLAPGTAIVRLDAGGTLRSLSVLPAPAPLRTESAREVDWSLLFEFAGIDPAMLSASAPRWPPEVHSDQRIAWVNDDVVGTERLRIEAASVSGRPVSFRVGVPWATTRAGDLRDPHPIALGWFLVALFGGALMARHNLRLARGDCKGAFRLAAVVFGLWLTFWLLSVPHHASRAELGFMIEALAWGTFWGGVLWLFYISLEPFFRRLWPQRIVSWVRLLDGRFRDPLVGRDLLLGSTYGVGVLVAHRAFLVLSPSLGLPGRLSTTELNAVLPSLEDGGAVFGAMAANLQFGLFESLGAVTGLLILQLVLRVRWLSITAYVVLGAIYAGPFATGADLAVVIALVALGVFVVLRVGLLSFVIGTTLFNLLARAPLVSDPRHWSAPCTMLAVTVTALVGFHGFRMASALPAWRR